MLPRAEGKVIVAVIALAVLIATLAGVFVGSREAIGQVPPGGEMATMPRRDIPMMPDMGTTGGGSLVANSRWVYVLIGKTLYHFNAETLQEVRRVTIEPLASPNAPGREDKTE